MENNICKCSKCGAPTENQLELVTVKTMVDRGWRKNKYYQAMGDIVTTAICDNCVDQYIEKVTHPKENITKLAICTAIVFLGSIALYVLVPVTAFRVFCAIIAGITVLAFLQEFKNIRKKANEVLNRNEKDNRIMLAVELAGRTLPKKHNDAELTYVDSKQILKGNLDKIAKEYGISYQKLVSIRKFLREERRNQKLEDAENQDNNENQDFEK